MEAVTKKPERLAFCAHAGSRARADCASAMPWPARLLPAGLPSSAALGWLALPCYPRPALREGSRRLARSPEGPEGPGLGTRATRGHRSDPAT